MPKNHRLSFTATDTAAVCLLQSTTGAGSLLINGATIDLLSGWIGTARFGGFARKLTITSANNLSAVNFVITGKAIDGSDLTETIAGPNANTVTTTNAFTRVISVNVSAAVTAVSVGDDTVGTSSWIPMDVRVANFKSSAAGMVTGTISYTLQYTFDNVLSSTYSTSAVAFNSDLTAMVAATSNQFGYITNPVAAVRVVVNSSTGGSLNFDIIEEGISS